MQLGKHLKKIVWRNITRTVIFFRISVIMNGIRFFGAVVSLSLSEVKPIENQRITSTFLLPLTSFVISKKVVFFFNIQFKIVSFICISMESTGLCIIIYIFFSFYCRFVKWSTGCMYEFNRENQLHSWNEFKIHSTMELYFFFQCSLKQHLM